MKPRRIKGHGLYSVLQPIPGVAQKDVLAFKQRYRLWRRQPDVAEVLIVDHRRINQFYVLAA